MENWALDLRHAMRRLVKSKGYTAAAVLSLALGIGASTAVFTAVNRIFLTPLPVHRPSELVSLLTLFGERSGTGVSYPNYLDFRDRSVSFSELIARQSFVTNLGSGLDTERVLVTLVSDNYFDGLGVVMETGRAPGPNEEGPVVVMSHALSRRLGAALGERVRLNGHAHTLVGIAPEGFEGLSIGLVADLWVPIDRRYGILPPGLDTSLKRRDAPLVSVVGYLEEGVTLEQARSELAVIARQLEQAYPEANRERGATLEPFTLLPGFPNAELAAGLVGAMTGIILIIGCANVANFMLARSWSRRQETSIRLALGSGRARLAQQMLAESLLLSLLAGMVGLPILRLNPVFGELARPPIPIPIRLEWSPDIRVLGFAVLLAVVASLIAGVAPVLRLRGADPVTYLRSGAASTVEPARLLSLRFVLVAGQIGLGLACVIVSMLFARSLSVQLAADLGFEPEGVVAGSLELPAGRYDDETGPAFSRRLVERLEAAPGVLSASIATHIPLWDDFDVGFGRIHPEDRAPEDPADAPGAVKAFVGPGYFETLQLPLTRGRGIVSTDGRGSEPVAVISESVSAALFPDDDPIGRRLVFHGAQSLAFHNSGTERIVYRIVGVAVDAKHFSVGQRRAHFLYVPLSQEFSPGLSVLVRTRSAGGVTPAVVAREIEALDPQLPIFNLKRLPDVVLQSLFFLRAGTALVSFLGWMATTLAAVGIYSVVAYVASHRTHEVGLRMALGASSRDIAKLVLRETCVYGTIGMLGGFAVAFGLGRILGALLTGVSPSDPLAYAGAGLLLVMVIVGAALVPSLRAARIEPAVALKHQ